MVGSWLLPPTAPSLYIRKPAGSREEQTQLTPAETEFQKADLAVFSNSSNHRQDPIVPLVVPTVNLPHMDLIPHQRKAMSTNKGFLVCNSNCAVIGVAIPFAALQAAFGPVECASVVTLQAVSGAGYPGVSSMDIVDNIVPYIKGEEDKLENEARKILGHVNAEGTAFEEQKDLRISASCTRVPVLDGHTACVSLRFARRPAPSAEECAEVMRSFQSEAEKLGCPSAPKPAIKVFDEPDRPQPRLDRDVGGGYTVSVGRVRGDDSGIFDLKFVAMSHNSELPCPGGAVRGCLANESSCHRCGGVVHHQRRGRRPQGLHQVRWDRCGCSVCVDAILPNIESKYASHPM